MTNMDPRTVAGFGDEWARFDQSVLAQAELENLFALYFKVFPWEALPPNPVGFDLGCGSGRWAKCVAPRVAKLHCIDASGAALAVARRNLHAYDNCEFHLASVSSIPVPDGSMDFGYSIGVLHHVPDTFDGIRACVAKLRAGAPFLLYIYYAFDNRPRWFRLLWRLSDVVRRFVSRLPYSWKYVLSSLFAVVIYLPLARFAALLERLGFSVALVPLSAYRHRSLYTLRTDALDRFGTRLEQRFTAAQIGDMMQRAGLERITFSPSVPYWCAVGYRKG